MFLLQKMLVNFHLGARRKFTANGDNASAAIQHPPHLPFRLCIVVVIKVSCSMPVSFRIPKRILATRATERLGILTLYELCAANRAGNSFSYLCNLVFCILFLSLRHIALQFIISLLSWHTTFLFL